MDFWNRESEEGLAPSAPRIDPVLQCRWERCKSVLSVLSKNRIHSQEALFQEQRTLPALCPVCSPLGPPVSFPSFIINKYIHTYIHTYTHTHTHTHTLSLAHTHKHC